MSSIQELISSRTIRHPTTWIVAAVAAIYGGLEMYYIREAKRAAGANLQFPWLWLERGVDFLAGAIFQIAFVLAAVWIVAIFMDNVRVWWRQSAVMLLYLAFAAYSLFN